MITYPLVIGKKALDTAEMITSGIDKRKSMRLAAEIRREEALLNMCGMLLDTVCAVIKGVNERETLRLETECQYERHRQTMERVHALDQYGRSYYNEMTDRERRRFHEVYLNSFK